MIACLSYCLKSSSCIDGNSNGACDDSNQLIKNPYDCPLPPQPQFAYEDSFARNMVVPLCAATYAANAQTQTCLDPIGVRLKRQLILHCDISQKDTCSGYTATKADARAIIIAFR